MSTRTNLSDIAGKKGINADNYNTMKIKKQKQRFIQLLTHTNVGSMHLPPTFRNNTNNSINIKKD